jgi:hypothetical protein
LIPLAQMPLFRRGDRCADVTHFLLGEHLIKVNVILKSRYDVTGIAQRTGEKQGRGTVEVPRPEGPGRGKLGKTELNYGLSGI